MNPVYTASNLPQGAAPVDRQLHGKSLDRLRRLPVPLSWSATGASYLIVTPEIGAVRGNSATVAPSQTTTYTLAATNQFGRATQNVTVTVP